ncbi:MAG: PQQ-binding-like beta-propeller repeat protein [Bryobacteraceae bacterium]
MRIFLIVSIAWQLAGADWPEWRGAGRGGVWMESGVPERFPENGLTPVWRTPVEAGFSGPAVAGGRVFVMDRKARADSAAAPMDGVERALALDEATGRVLWTREWPASYLGLARNYASGPRATPTVDGDRVYTLGAKGILHCLDTKTGAVRWRRDFEKDYKTQVPGWGMSGAPIVAGELLIAIVGGEDNAKVVAFNKHTGEEAWRALAADSEPGYSSPILTEAGGRRQLIVWHAGALVSLNPANGEIYWQQPFRTNLGLSVATPVRSGPWLFVSAFYDGPMLMKLDGSAPRAKLAWQGKSRSEIDTDGLHALINTPVIDGDYIYGICSYGQMRCVRLSTGERVWETLAATREKARWATGFLVKNGDRYFLNNDRGELIQCRLSPAGYEELSRTPLIRPTSTMGIGKRTLGAVNWSHPAYANGHVVARNDEEIVRVRLR